MEGEHWGEHGWANLTLPGLGIQVFVLDREDHPHPHLRMQQRRLPRSVGEEEEGEEERITCVDNAGVVDGRSVGSVVVGDACNDAVRHREGENVVVVGIHSHRPHHLYIPGEGRSRIPFPSPCSFQSQGVGTVDWMKRLDNRVNGRTVRDAY